MKQKTGELTLLLVLLLFGYFCGSNPGLCSQQNVCHKAMPQFSFFWMFYTTVDFMTTFSHMSSSELFLLRFWPVCCPKREWASLGIPYTYQCSSFLFPHPALLPFLSQLHLLSWWYAFHLPVLLSSLSWCPFYLCVTRTHIYTHTNTVVNLHPAKEKRCNICFSESGGYFT